MRAGAVVGLLLTAGAARAATITVGQGKMHPRPCAAFAAAADGDVIEIDAGVYGGDVCRIAKNNLTIRGVGGGRAKIDAAGMNSGGKGIWVIGGNNTTVENVELYGAKVPDLNGAGIRMEGSGLTIRNCHFHHNENGILGGGGEVLIEHSEFGHNGNCLDPSGCAHNMYISEATTKLTVRFSYSHHASSGHLIKSRARENLILYNRLMDEVDGTSSFNIDLPNGGTSYVIGNLIQQGMRSENSAVISYGAEGLRNPGKDLYVVNNTFVNDRGNGNHLQLAGATDPVVVRNNIFFGGGQLSNAQALVTASNNFMAGDPMLMDRAAGDYRLRAGSPCIDMGTNPGMSASGASLVPTFHYLHPMRSEVRLPIGTLDIGAYEMGGSGGPPPDAAAPLMPPATDVRPADMAPRPRPMDAAAGPRLDAAVPPVAGRDADSPPLATDAGATPEGEKSGCSCDAGGRGGTAPGMVLVFVAVAAARRLRPRSKRPSPVRRGDDRASPRM